MTMIAVSILGVGERLCFCLAACCKQKHRSGKSDLIKRALLVWSWSERLCNRRTAVTGPSSAKWLYFSCGKFWKKFTAKKYWNFEALDGHRSVYQRSCDTAVRVIQPNERPLIGQVKVKKMIFAWRLIYLGFYPSLAVYQVCFLGRGNGNPWTC